MEIEYSRKDRIVGTFVVCIAALLLSVIILVGRGKNWFEKYNTYYTSFDESYNLQVGADVKLFKTNIGKVKQITVEDKVKIKMAILAHYESRIREDTLVTVESPTLIGSEYVSIVPGLMSTAVLPDGSEIRSKAKRSIRDILAEFEVEKSAKMFVQAIQNLSEFTENLSKPDGPLQSAIENVRRTTANIEAVTGGIASGDGTLGNLVRSTELLDIVKERLEQIDEILGHVSQATAQTPVAMDQVQLGIARFLEIAQATTESIEVLKRILTDIESNMPAVTTILENAEKGSHDIPGITRSVSQGIQEARAEIDTVDKVLQSIQKNILIRGNLPPEPVGQSTDAGLRR